MSNPWKVGAVVEWESQANGTTKKKAGEILAVIPAKTYPTLEELFGKDYHKQYNSSPIDLRCLKRDHESYVVAVKGKTDRARPKLYWPRVSQLKVKHNNLAD